jgi:hypothetical protein
VAEAVSPGSDYRHHRDLLSWHYSARLDHCSTRRTRDIMGFKMTILQLRQISNSTEACPMVGRPEHREVLEVGG